MTLTPPSHDDRNHNRQVMSKGSRTRVLARQHGQAMHRSLVILGIAALISMLLMAFAANARAETPASTEPAVTAYDGDPTLTGSYLAARFAETRRDLSAAADFYELTLDLAPGNQDLMLTTMTLQLSDGRIADAGAIASDLAKRGDNGLSRLAQTVRALKEKNFKRAGRNIAAMEGQAFNEVLKGLLGAWAQAGSGNLDEALELVQGLEGPGWVEVFRTYHEGLILHVSGERERALRQLERAFNMDSTSLRLAESYASALSRAGKVEEAEAVLLGLLAATPQQPLLEADLKQLRENGVLEQVVKTPVHGAAEVLYGLGAGIGRDGGEELAAIYLNLALHLDPEAEIARMALAAVYERIQMFERAVIEYEAIPKEHPYYQNAEIRLGILLERLERPDEADAHMLALIKDNPADLEAVSIYGNILRSRRDFEGAAKIYSIGIETIEEPQLHHWPIYYGRGIAYERTKQWPKAEVDFLQALELVPDNPDVLNYLAYSWVDMGMNLERSVDMLETAVELSPRSGYIIDSLGWVYYKLGRYEEAVEQLERAVQLEPAEAVINDHLGDAYWKVGRRLEARFQWSHARDLETDEELLEIIEGKLANGLREGETETVQDTTQGSDPVEAVGETSATDDPEKAPVDTPADEQ